MPFNVTKLKKFCIEEIRRFAKVHQNERFYAFAVDADLLCLNSEEGLKKTIKEYREQWENDFRPIDRWEDLSEDELRRLRWLLDMHESDGLNRSDHIACLAVINDFRQREREKGNPYRTKAGRKGLRENTGDWSYQGFARMTASAGFDPRAYSKHYNMDDDEQPFSAYAKAMDDLVKRLQKAGAFRCLKVSPKFRAMRVEHDY